MFYQNSSFYRACRTFTLFVSVSAAFSVHAIAAMPANQPQPQKSNHGTVLVALETNHGDVVIEVYQDEAPLTAANFLRYVDEGYYADTLFHRVIPGFVVQGGGFVGGMNLKRAYPPVSNESSNGLRNVRGSLAMARKREPDSATSQFYINLNHNTGLDSRPKKAGYTVFGRVVRGMDVLDSMVNVPTAQLGNHRDVPTKDIVVHSMSRLDPKSRLPEPFVAGVHYMELDALVPTHDPSKIEVVEAFAYGCENCYEFEGVLRPWLRKQGNDIDYQMLPSVLNQPMTFYAKTWFVAKELGIEKAVHEPLFQALLVKQEPLHHEALIAKWFTQFGVEPTLFASHFDSMVNESHVKRAQALTRQYELGSVPQLIVNGKYRIDPARAGGYENMLMIAEYLIQKERNNL